MQSLHALDNSLSYQAGESIEGSSSISNQWSSSLSLFETSMALESTNEAYCADSNSAPLPPLKFITQVTSRHQHHHADNHMHRGGGGGGGRGIPGDNLHSSYQSTPSSNHYGSYNGYHHSSSPYSGKRVYPVQNQHLYQSTTENSEYSLADIVESGRSCSSSSCSDSSRSTTSPPNDSVNDCGGRQLSLPEYYPRTPKMNGSGSGCSNRQMGSLSASLYGVRQKSTMESRSPRWGSSTLPNMKLDLYHRLDVQANMIGNDADRENIAQILDKLPNDQLTMSSVREALGIVDPRKTSSTSTTSDFPFRGSSSLPVLPPEAIGTMGLGLTSSKQEEVLKAAKSLFSKRTRTLYQWLCPDASKTKLKASVTAAWDTLSEPEKHFYISQVLGRFGLQESSLMVNPQLDGIKGLPVENIKHSMKASICKARSVIEDQQAVNALFESCDDSHNWTSFRRQKKIPKAPRKNAQLIQSSLSVSSVVEQEVPEQIRKKRKYTRRNLGVGKRLPGSSAPSPSVAATKVIGRIASGPPSYCGHVRGAVRSVSTAAAATSSSSVIRNLDADAGGSRSGSISSIENVELNSCVVPSSSSSISTVSGSVAAESDRYKFVGDDEFCWNNPLNPEDLFPEISF